MKCFLDSQVYMYTETEWADYRFVERLESLLTALKDFERLEKETGTLYETFRFVTSSECIAQIYESNPSKNVPEASSFYPQQFRSRVLPQLLRRFDIDVNVDELYAGLNLVSVSQVPDIHEPGNKIQTEFRESICLLETVYGASERLLVYFEGYCSLRERAGFFAPEVVLPTPEVNSKDPTVAEQRHLQATDPVRLLWRAVQGNLPALRLNQAILCKYLHLANLDPEWARYRVGPMEAADGFWKSIREADFQGRSRLYLERMLYAVVQISSGRDITINSHRMAGHTIIYSEVRHVLWNAYVFKMGATDTDKRCSRIYYIRTGRGAILVTFEPDAHP